MEKLDYQDLLSKCIQNGLPGGGFWKSSSVLQAKGEPAVGIARLLENSTRGCRKDPSGAVQGPATESAFGYRVVTALDGIAINKCRSPLIATSNNAGKARTRERVLRSDGLKIDGFPRSFLKHRGMVTKIPPSTISFRNLLEGAISASRVKPSTSVQDMAESGIRSALIIEFEKDCASGEKYPFTDERLIDERHNGVVNGRSMPQACVDAKVLSVERLAKLGKGEGNFAHRVRDSGSLSGDTVGDSRPHVSYSSLLQSQLGDDADDVRTESRQNAAESSLVDAAGYYSLLNSQLHPAEVEGGFSSLLEKTMALRPFTQRASFPAADSVPIGEQILDVRHSDKPSYVPAGAESRSADAVLERDLREPLRTTANPASPALSRDGEDGSRAVVLAELGTSMAADFQCIDKRTLTYQLPEGDCTDVAGDESRFTGILSEADVVGEQGSSCVDEMPDVQLLDVISGALAGDEARLSEKALYSDTLISSESAAVSASTVSANTDQSDTQALVLRERSALGAADFVSTDERILDAHLPEGPSSTLGTGESGSVENAPKKDSLESSEAAGVRESFGIIRTEAADLQAGLERASCVVAGLTCDENASGVQLREGLSRDLAVDGSRFAEVVADGDSSDLSGAAPVAVSPVPLLMENNVSRVDGEVAGLMNSSEIISDAVVSDERSHAVALHRSRSVGNIVIKSSEADGDSASLVPILRGDDVLMAEVVVDKGVGHFRSVLDTGQGKGARRSFNPSCGQLLGERIQSPTQFLVTVKNRLEGQADLVNADTALDLAFQACHKQMDPNGDSVDVLDFDLGDVQVHCGVVSVSETDVTVSSEVAMASSSAERGLLLQKVVVDEHVDTSCDENVRSEELRDTVTVRKRSRQAALKQTGNGSVLFIGEHNDEMRDDHKNGASGNMRLESNSDFDVTETAMESECDISKGVPVQYVHTEEVIDELNSNSLMENSSSTLVPPIGHLARGEPQQSLEHSGTRSFCSEGVSGPKDVVAILGSSGQAGRKPAEDISSVAGKDEEDNSCYTQVLEGFVGQDARSTEHLMVGGNGCRSLHCVGCLVVTSNTVSPYDNENLVDLGRIHTSGRDHMVSLTENKLEQERMLRRPQGSIAFVKRSEVERYKALGLADEAPEIQIAVTPFSESRAVNMGLVFCRTCLEKFPSPLLPLVEGGIRNEVERVPENHVGEIVHCATDSGISVDPADQVLSTHSNAISEGLRQLFLRDSDVTISDSQESAQGTRRELVAGIEVQSPLVMKSKDSHTGHLDELEDSHRRHLEDLEDPLIRHLEELDDNEEQPYALPLNGAVHDQLVGGRVLPYKKKARLRAYNHERAIRGTKRSYIHPSGSKINSQLLKPGNRCRRKRHIYPDQPVPVFIEGRDEGFQEADGGSFLRWLAHQDEGNPAPSTALEKWVRKHGLESVKSVITIPSFRVISDYEGKQQEVEKRRKLEMQPQPISSSHLTLVSSSTLQPSEYDMDDEDEKWLHAWNKRLTGDGLNQPITENKFEEIIEYFERRSAEMIMSAAGVFPGIPQCGKPLSQPLLDGSLRRTSPSGFGVLSINLDTSGTPVSGNLPTFDPPPMITRHPTALTDDLRFERQALVSSSNRVDRNSPSPASRVRFHSLVSENERKPSNSDVGVGFERPSRCSLRKSLKPSALVKHFYDCCICNGGEDDDNNPVYTCKRCLIHVHQSCYGVREKFRDDDGRVIAPSNWCCRKCEAVVVGRAQPNVSCTLCRKRGGALKPTVVAQKWAHVACALYTNETFFVDPDAMEPIDGIAAVAARAQKQQERCELCGVKKGICSLCAVKDCRAPFHVSCGVGQGASFELRQSKLKAVGVRSFCPRHARATAVESVPSAELKDRHVLSSSVTSAAIPSATASGSISTASTMDDREEWSSRQRISHSDGRFGEPAALAKSVSREVDLTYNVKSVNGKVVEDAGGAWSKGIRFAFKRRWHESCYQASESGLSSGGQKKCGDGTGVSGGKMEAPGCKSTWQGVEPGQKLKKIKFKFGRLAHNLDSNLSPTLVHREIVGGEVPHAQKMKDVMHAVGELRGDAGIYERDSEFLKGLSLDRFAKEVKELMILEDAMKSGVAPGRIMREVFVYWRAKRAAFKGSLLSELHHEQWLRFQGIFNKDVSDEERGAAGKMASSPKVPQAQQPSSLSNEKTLDMAKGIRMQLERVRRMAQMVVQREKIKYSRQFVLGSLASVELNRALGISGERHCVWCPSIKTLLKCGTCLRSFCFNCFKHRKGFGVKGWMTAMKQPMYICNYCRELSSEQADLSNSLDRALKEMEESGTVSTLKDASGPASGVVSTSVTCSKHVVGARGNGMGKGRVKGRSWNSPGSGLLRVAERVVVGPVNKNATEGKFKRLEIGLGNGNSWTASKNARFSPRCGSEATERYQSKPVQLENGLDKFLNSAHSQIEHSSFEATLRRLKILRCSNTGPHQDLVTASVEIPSRSTAAGPGTDGVEAMNLSTTFGGNLSVPCSGPALLVYRKKRNMILSESLESPPSAYDIGDQPCPPTGL